VLVALFGIAYVSYAAPAVLVNRAAFAYPRADLFRYSAKWWSYLVPPVENPLLGAAAHRAWDAIGVREGLLEQQVSLGWGVIALGLIAVWRWLVRTNPGGDDVRQPAPGACVPVLIIVAVAALVCSLSPERTIGAFTFVRPSALLYQVVPMFRSYARFGVVVQLMAALLAGVGLDYLLRAGTRARIVCAALVALAAGDYVVSPSALWRDVLPTTAHRWITRQTGNVRALDCTPFNQESQSVQWLTGNRVTLLGGSITDCKEPNLPQKLAAMGYTHLLVRRRTGDRQWLEDHRALDGLRVAADFNDGQVFAVTANTPAIYTAAITGFFPREHTVEWTWRWMGKDAVWTIVNTRTQPIVTTLGIELSAFHVARRMELRLDEHELQTFVVAPSRRMYKIGPLTVMPGGHELVFHPLEAPTVADEVARNSDRRPLSFALGTWDWNVPAGQP
jgi:hypothetical protein